MGQTPRSSPSPSRDPLPRRRRCSCPSNGNTPAQAQFGGIFAERHVASICWRSTIPAWRRTRGSDQAFIDEWNAAIDMYGEVFSGVTLVATTGSGLPNFSTTGFTIPSCLQRGLHQSSRHGLRRRDDDSVLLRRIQPSAGPTPRRPRTSGMEASRRGLNLGVTSVKLLSQRTAQLTAPSAQILGGAQFNTSFAELHLAGRMHEHVSAQRQRHARRVQHSAHLHHTRVPSGRVHPAGLPRPRRHSGESGKLHDTQSGPCRTICSRRSRRNTTC